MGDALKLLPEEIWGLIIEELEDSEDIINVFRAFPELEGIQTQRKKARWLFDQVIPHLFKWLPSKDVLSLRLTSKRWSRAVDQVMENHLTLRAHRDDGKTRTSAKFWIRRTVQKDRFLCCGSTRSPRIRSGEDSSIEFLSKMDKHILAKRNPFVGRMLLVQEHAMFMDGVVGENDPFFTISDNIIRKFGEHLWYLELGNYLRQPNPRRFSEAVLDSLDHLPNLRRLELNGVFRSQDFINQMIQFAFKGEFETYISHRLTFLPALPHLESLLLNMRGVPLPLASILMSKYSFQVKRLSLELTLWREEYKDWIFPNLTEFTVIGNCKEGLCKLLGEINAPGLLSLGLDIVAGEFCIEDDIIWKLSRFKRIEHLHLWCSQTGNSLITESGCFSLNNLLDILPLDAIPTLKSLVIKDGVANAKLQYKFLVAFPNLEYLFIESTTRLLPKRCLDENGIRIREYLHDWNMYDSNVWKYLPKLKEIILRGQSGSYIPHAVENVRIKRFTRDEYNYLEDIVCSVLALHD